MFFPQGMFFSPTDTNHRQTKGLELKSAQFRVVECFSSLCKTSFYPQHNKEKEIETILSTFEALGT